jgi:hypothetical protein
MLSLIAAGSTATAAAASAGIHRNTISNWLRGSPAFSQALACVHFRPGSALARTGRIARPAAVRLKAALAILRLPRRSPRRHPRPNLCALNRCTIMYKRMHQRPCSRAK